MPTLLEITELEDIVLFDSSANPADYLLQAIYDSRRYAELNRSILIRAQEDIHQFLDFLRMENTFTTPDSLEHFRAYQLAVAAKQAFLNRRQRDTNNNVAWEHKNELLEAISHMVFDIVRIVRQKLFKPADPALYTAFQESIPHVLDLGDISMTISKRYARLYAAALYLTLVENRRVGIVANGRELNEGIEMVARCIMALAPDTPLRRFPITHYANFYGNGLRISYTTKNEEQAQAVNH